MNLGLLYQVATPIPAFFTFLGKEPGFSFINHAGENEQALAWLMQSGDGSVV